MMLKNKKSDPVESPVGIVTAVAARGLEISVRGRV